MLRPNTRLLKGNARPAFTVAVRNQSRRPENLLEASITASESVGGKVIALRVYRYEELVQEEETRQAVAKFGTALSAFGRAMSASNAGYANTTGSVASSGPYGTQYGTYSATTYDPARPQIAQSAASAESAADFERVQAEGQANLEGLQSTILKDNTVMPGEWCGGTIVLEPPQKHEHGPSTYRISVRFADEEHVFTVAQTEK